MYEKDDPFAVLLNRAVLEPAIDLAILHIDPDARQKPMPHTVPIRLSGWKPVEGELVFAIGYPELDCTELDEIGQRALLHEGMYGAYGRVIAVHKDGRSTSNVTPVIEVEGDWPGGMSGGPVFNSATKRGRQNGVTKRGQVHLFLASSVPHARWASPGGIRRCCLIATACHPIQEKRLASSAL